mgnify:CR=1 FL=1
MNTSKTQRHLASYFEHSVQQFPDHIAVVGPDGRSLTYRELHDRTYPRRPAEALPTRTFTSTGTMNVGPTRVSFGTLPPAHTNGDIYVFLPDQNILMVSDALTPGRYPVMDYSTGGWISGMIDASTVLQGIANDETRIVPGLGPIQTLTDLKRQREMLVTVKDRVWTMIRQGKSLDEVAKEAPTREFDQTLGANENFLKTLGYSLDEIAVLAGASANLQSSL